MIDLKHLRDNPELYRERLGTKKFGAPDIEGLLALDDRRRGLVTEAEQARAGQNAASKEMAALPKGSDDFKAKVAEMKALSAKVKELQAAAEEASATLARALLDVPNLPHESVPVGRGEAENVTVKTVGETGVEAYPHARAHFEIEGLEKYIDLEGGNRITGAGFPVLIGPLARLNRALIQFCLDEAVEAGYVEVQPPLLVNADSATATGQLPDKEGQMYHTPEDDLYLIPTAEVPVTNLYRDAILDPAQLPLRHCAYSPCFRREAGSYGKDVRGLNRLHQFDKVEMVKWVHPDESFDELEKLREDAENLLVKLELPYRLLSICTGDIGFPHSKQYDLDVWAAGQKRWLEVSSCSNFTDFQARRANIRFRDEGTKKPRFVHTLNGSGLGLARTFVALIENNLQADGSIAVPAALAKYTGTDRLVWKA